MATFEKTLTSAQARRIAGQILMIAHLPGSTPPTAASDLAIFLADADTSQADAIITAAADGLDLITTAYKKKVIALPQPVAFGALRFQITGNGVNDARGTLWVYILDLALYG